MKIKTITCHNVYNFGASLQAYAMVVYLRSFGHDVEIIDYEPVYLRHYRLSGVPDNSSFNRPLLRQAYQIAKFPGRLYERLTSTRKKVFDRFTTEFLPLSETVYPDAASLKAAPPEAELYIAGSDQIWNLLFHNGKDPAFFLDFVPEGRKKISYAASFAVDTLALEDAQRIKTWLEKLDAIAVRESSGVTLLKQMELEGIQVVDPVFLLPNEHWDKIAIKPELQNYILVYDFDNNENIKQFACHFAAKTGDKIVSLFPVDWADEVWSDAGPREFIGAIQNASIVLSNSFHATAFSIIFKKNFYVVNRTEGINARMKDLVGDIGLSERLICAVPTVLSAVDYTIATRMLQKKVEISKAYLTAQTQ